MDNYHLKQSRLAVKLLLGDSNGLQRPAAEADYSTQARQSMMDLLEICRDVANYLSSKTELATSNDPYSDMRRLDHQLDHWFADLNPALKQCPTNGSRSAQFYFYTIHLIFNSGKILLHRRFAFHFNNLNRADTVTTRPVRRHLLDHSRYICISCAIRISQLFEGYLPKLDIRLLHSSGSQLIIFAAQAMVEYLSMLPSDEIAEPMSDFRSMRKALAEMSKSSQAVDRRLQSMDEKLSELRGLMNPLVDERLLTRPPPIKMAEHRPSFSGVRRRADMTGPPTPLRRESEPRLQTFAKQAGRASVNGQTGVHDSPAAVPSGNDRFSVDSGALSRSRSNWDELEILGREPMMISMEEHQGWKKAPSTDFLNRGAGMDGLLFDRPQGGDLTPGELFSTNWDETFEPEGWVEFGF